MPSLIFDSEIPKPKSSRPLCYEGGTRVIALTENRWEDLVLNSEILDKASPFFKAGAQGWAHDSKTVKDPSTGAEVTIFTYHLKLNQDDWTLILTQEPPASPTALKEQVSHNPTRRFYLSDNAAGFLPRVGDDNGAIVLPDAEDYDSLRYLQDVQSNHKAIFMLLHGEQIKLSTSRRDKAYHDMADMVAYAEFYQLLDLIGPALREVLLEIEDLWKDTGENYLFHLALAQKVRCEETFEDAMRHYIGNGVDLSHLVTKLSLDPGKAFMVALSRDQHNKRVKTLTSDLHALSLATYVYLGDPAEESAAAEILKTKPMDFAGKLIQYGDTAESTACHIFSQWLNHHQAGDAYWLKQRQNECTHGWGGEERSKILNPGSLRRACSMAVAVTQAGDEMRLFDLQTIDSFVQMSSLSRDGESDAYDIIEIQKKLKSLVNEMAHLALPFIAQPDFRHARARDFYSVHPPDHNSDDDASDSSDETSVGGGYASPGPNSYRTRGSGHGRGRGGFSHAQFGRPRTPGAASQLFHRDGYKFFNRVGITAQNDNALEYFTCTSIDIRKILPWSEDFDKPYRISGLESASAAWKEALGVSDNGECDEAVEDSESSGDYRPL